MAMFSFYVVAPEKSVFYTVPHENIKKFLSGGIERNQWYEMGQKYNLRETCHASDQI